MLGQPEITAGYLDGQYVAFQGWVKNTRGEYNIHYVGENCEGVCMEYFWNKYLKKEKSLPQ